MVTIGLSLIARNEQEMISTCLRSVQGADQIVCIDTGSTDDTVSICKRYTDKIYHFDWIDDFAAARNFAQSKCTTDYVLIVDADEKLDCSIEDIRKALTDDCAGLVLDRIDSIDGSLLSQEVRVLKRSIQWQGRVYESPILNGSHAEMRRHCKKTNLKISCRTSPNHQIDKDRNIRILLKEHESNPADVVIQSFLAREYSWRYQRDHKPEWLDQTIYWLEMRRKPFYEESTLLDEFSESRFLLSISYALKYELTKNPVWWDKALQSALLSFCSLPINVNSADQISNLLARLPSGKSYLYASAFWQSIADRCEGYIVGIPRNRNRCIDFSKRPPIPPPGCKYEGK
jgi:glycosyltransferase involved in cell wall biosynthesis